MELWHGSIKNNPSHSHRLLFIPKPVKKGLSNLTTVRETDYEMSSNSYRHYLNRGRGEIS